MDHNTPRSQITPHKPAPLAGGLSMDTDRLLVLVIAVMLWQNNASVPLILALLYIAF